MTKILENKLLLGFVIFSVGAIGFLSFADADDTNEYLEGKYRDVPSNCEEVVTTKGNATHYDLICEWRYSEMATAKQDNLTDAEIKALEKAKEDRKAGKEPIIDNSWVNLPEFGPAHFPDVKENRPEKLKDYFCNIENPSTTDVEKCNYYTHWSFCEGGLKANSPIKKYEYWIVSDYEPSDDLQIDLHGADQFAFDLKDYEWCRAELAQQVTNSKTHYQTLSKEIAKGEYNPYHRDFVTTDMTFPTQGEVTKTAILTQANIAKNNSVCANPSFTIELREQMGCEVEIRDCYMPTEDEMVWLWERYNVYTLAQTNKPWGDMPIKQYFTEKYDACKERVASFVPTPNGLTAFEKRILNSKPMTEFFLMEEAEREGKKYLPHWIKKQTVTIHGFGDHTDFHESNNPENKSSIEISAND